MKESKYKLTPRALNKDNIRDFSFLVPKDVVDDILSDDGTSGFAVLMSGHNIGSKYVGALCGRFIKRTEYAITSIYVSEGNRGQGVGTFLMKTLYELLDEKDADISICVTRITKEAADLVKFLEKAGFEEYFIEGERTYVTDIVGAARLKLSATPVNGQISPFSMIPKRSFLDFDPKQKEGFVPMPLSGFDGESIDRDLSMGIILDGELLGFCILEKYIKECLIMSAFWVDEKVFGAYAISLLSAVRDEALKKYDTDTKLFLPVVNDKVADLIEEVFPKKSLKEGVLHYKKSA